MSVLYNLGSAFKFLFFVLTVLLLEKHLSNFYLEASPQNEPQIIIDEETEDFLTDWIKRFFKVAGISLDPKVYLLNTLEVNAGATFGGVIIVYTGLIIKCKSASQLLGVLAHETGHIAGGHMAKTSAALTDASMPSMIPLILGGAAALATGNPGALMAGLAGSAQVFERSLLRHSREQEDSADASALSYLTTLKIPLEGLAEFHDLLGRHYTTGKEDPYVQTHPLPTDRKEKIMLYVKEKNLDFKTPPHEEERFQRIRAKLFGYLKKPVEILSEYPMNDHSMCAQYARLINDYVHSKASTKAQVALKKIEKLLEEKPDDPYFIEMQGQFLFETGKPDQAIGYLEKALEKRPTAQNIRLMLSHALIEVATNEGGGKISYLDQAITMLTHILEKNAINPFAWRLLAMAYGRKSQDFDAAACLAEEAIQINNYDLAKMQADKGLKAHNVSLKKRAADILQQIKNESE